jgi:hypothetical protein
MLGIDIDLPTSGAMGKKLKKADKAGTRTALIMGSDELAKNTYPAAQSKRWRASRNYHLIRTIAAALRRRLPKAFSPHSGRSFAADSRAVCSAKFRVIETRPKRSFGMSLDSSMDKVLERRREVEERLSDSANMSNSELAQFSRELSDLRPVCEQIELVRRIEAEFADALIMVEEAGDDLDMLEMAQAEADLLKAQLPDVEAALQLLLLPKDKDDSRNAILEVRAGTGGDEAALFASNLFSMYQRFAAKHGWKFEVMEVSETGIGGYKEATATISGQDVFARLKFESGVHRVQRVP